MSDQDFRTLKQDTAEALLREIKKRAVGESAVGLEHLANAYAAVAESAPRPRPASPVSG